MLGAVGFGDCHCVRLICVGGVVQVNIRPLLLALGRIPSGADTLCHSSTRLQLLILSFPSSPSSVLLLVVFLCLLWWFFGRFLAVSDSSQHRDKFSHPATPSIVSSFFLIIPSRWAKNKAKPRHLSSAHLNHQTQRDPTQLDPDLRRLGIASSGISALHRNIGMLGIPFPLPFVVQGQA